MGKKVNSKIVVLTHLKYTVYAFVSDQKEMMIKVGCHFSTTQDLRKKVKEGYFKDKESFIDEAWPYFLAIEKYLKRMKKDLG